MNPIMIIVKIKEAGFREGKPVISGIDFTLAPGELLLIVGASGSGKTTLILSLTGVLSNLLNGYTNGEIRLFNVDPLTPDGFSKIPRIVGVVLQDPDKQIAMPTPVDEVAFTLENLGYSDDDIRELTLNSLKHLGLVHKAYSSTENLSGGEKKRLCIAASIVHTPKLLIFDEPTANLDPWGVSETISYIREFKEKGHTIMVIEHKARYFLDLADKLLVIENGKQVLFTGKEQIRRNRDRIVSLLEGYGVDSTTPKLRETRDTGISKGRVTVHVEDLWFKYPLSEEFVLKNVNLKLNGGEVAVIVGPNGSGKTTLLKIIAGFYKPNKGFIKVMGTEPYRIKGKDRARAVFYVPQEPDYLFVYDSVYKELKASGIREDELKSLLDGINWLMRLLDESPYKLSHGQRRWLTYTIAKLYDPKVILFDEPSAGLDNKLLKGYVEWVRNVSKEGKTVIIATHDVRLVCEVASKTFIMKNGVIEEVPLPKAVEFLEEPVWGIQQQ